MTNRPAILRRWEGTFKTTSAFNVSLGITVEGKLSVPLADAEEYNTICELDYTGNYRTGHSLVGTVYVRKDRMSMTLTPQQSILFTITSKTPDKIEGSYACVCPHDAGIFTLKPVN